MLLVPGPSPPEYGRTPSLTCGRSPMPPKHGRRSHPNYGRHSSMARLHSSSGAVGGICRPQPNRAERRAATHAGPRRDAGGALRFALRLLSARHELETRHSGAPWLRMDHYGPSARVRCRYDSGKMLALSSRLCLWWDESSGGLKSRTREARPRVSNLSRVCQPLCVIYDLV